MWTEEELRWFRLFDDLEAQADALGRAADQGDVAERTRIETGRVALMDRLRGAQGADLGLRCLGVGPLGGRLDRVGADCVLLTRSVGIEVLVPVSSVVTVWGLTRGSAPPGPVAGRLGFRSALRGLARDRSSVRVALVDGTSAVGTVDRAGLDHLELAEHPLDEPRRARSVRRVLTVPLPAVAAVLRR